MTSKLIKARAKNFIKGLKGLSMQQIQTRCKVELDFLRGEYKLNYFQTILTEYRKQAKLQGFAGKKDISLLLIVTKAEKKERAKSIKKGLKLRHKDQRYISDYKGLISLAIENLESGNIPKIACSLCLLTGRRAGEIMKTAKFFKVGKQKDKLYFAGQLKKRNSAEKYKIYALGDSAGACKRALAVLRESAPTAKLDLEKVERRYNPQLNRVATMLFGEYLGRCTPHDLRKAYGAISAHLYKQPNESPNAFLAPLLGHNSDDIQTANSYLKYYL
jgi:integrase